MKNDYQSIVIDFIASTSSAILVSDGDRKIWLTRNAIKFNDQHGTTPGLFDDLQEGENILLEVMGWLLENTGLSELAEE